MSFRMRQKLRMMISFGCLLAFLLAVFGLTPGSAPPSSVYAVTVITVNTTDDELNSDGDCSLREAIQAANTNAAVDLCAAGSSSDTDQIVLTNGATYGLSIAGADENANATGDLDFVDNAGATLDVEIVVASGGTATIDANDIDRVLHLVNTVAVRITGVTITDGSAVTGLPNGSLGGGILNEGGTLTLDASKVTSNTATSNGGGIFNRSAGTVIVQNGSVIGGAGAGNIATNNGGGGIFNELAGSSVTIDASTVSANTTGNSGGGIYNFNGATLTVQNGSVIGGTGAANVATVGGGIINTGTVTITASTVSFNRATLGGGIYNALTLTITNSRVSANAATNNGGGIYNQAPGTTTVQTGSVIGGAGAANTAAVGGGIHNTGAGGTVTIDASTVSANTGFGQGGGIRNVSAGTVTIQNGSVIGGVGAANTSGEGGGIYNAGTNSVVTINASTVSANTASTQGGGIFNSTSGSVTVQNGSLIGGAGAGNGAQFGAGVYNASTAKTVVTGSRLLSNTASTNGGAIYSDTNTANDVSVTSSCIVGNSNTAFHNNQPASQTATGNWWGASTGPSGVGPGSGDSVSANVDFSGFLTDTILGCPYLIPPVVCPPFPATIANGDEAALAFTISCANDEVAFPGVQTINLAVGGTYTLTAADPNGGANGPTGLPSITVTNGSGTSTIIINGNGSTIERDGSAAAFRIFHIAADGNLTLNNVTVRGGSSANGGGLYNRGSLTLDASRVSANTATGSGGGINNISAGTVIVRNGSIIGGVGTANSTGQFGGGIFNSGIGSSVTIDASTVSANTAGEQGGGIFNHGGATLLIQNGSVIGGAGAGNRALISGGGIFNTTFNAATNSTVTIDASTVSANNAPAGGGIYNTRQGVVTVQDGSLIGGVGAGNSAQFGAGIFSESANSILTVDNSVISANIATGFGGAINNILGGTVFVQNNTVIGGAPGAGNQALQGGGIYNEATVTVSDSTISYNATTRNSGGGIAHISGTLTVTGSRLLYNTVVGGPNSTGGAVYNFANAVNAVSVTSSCIVGNSKTAFQNDAASSQTATGNWWGSSTGPGPVGPGLGDTVSNNVDFSSWLTEPILDCPEFIFPAEIVATKTVSGSLLEGSTITYTIVLNNVGAGAQHDNAGDEFTDLVPAGVTVTDVDATSGNPLADGNLVTWNGAITAGNSVTITITATINAPMGTLICNQGEVSYDSDGDDENDTTVFTDNPNVPSLNPTCFTVTPAPRISAEKSVSGTFEEGGTVTYLVVLKNNGQAAQPNNAGNEFSDTLPAGLTLVNATSTPSGTSISGNTVTWNGSIPVNGTVTITITATINAGQGGNTICNQGTAFYDADVNGSNEASVLTDNPTLGGTTDPTCFEVEQANVDLVASAQCDGDDLKVTITAGDGLFNITGSGPDLPQNGVGIGTHILSGPGSWTNVTVSEVGGDTESINLEDFDCAEPPQNVDLVASGQCEGDDLKVTITAGDGLFNITGSGPDLPQNGVGIGTYTLSGPGSWSNVTVTEQGGDQEAINLEDFDCAEPPQNVDLVASAQCDGDDLKVTITAGDGLFNITGSGPDLPQNGVGIGTYTLSGPGSWTNVTVTEQGGDQESINLEDFDCAEPPQNVDLVASGQCDGDDLKVTITAGDGLFNITGSGPDLPLNNVSTGTYTLSGPGSWSNVTVTEQGGDQEVKVVGSFDCAEPPQHVDLAAYAQCRDQNLRVTITAGDGPFNITGSGPDLPLNGVGTGTYTLSGPGSWSNVTVTEQSGDQETKVVGTFNCELPPPPTCTDPNERRDLRVVDYVHYNETTAWVEVRNSSINCGYYVNMVSYKVCDGSIDTQQIYSWYTGDPGAFIAPNSTLYMEVPICGDCQMQIDVFWGNIIWSFADGSRYSWPINRLLDSRHTDDPFCDCSVQQPQSAPAIESEVKETPAPHVPTIPPDQPKEGDLPSSKE